MSGQGQDADALNAPTVRINMIAETLKHFLADLISDSRSANFSPSDTATRKAPHDASLAAYAVCVRGCAGREVRTASRPSALHFVRPPPLLCTRPVLVDDVHK